MVNARQGSDHGVQGGSFIRPNDEAAFIRLMLCIVEQHKLQTPAFITARICAFDSFGATEMADFWRDALALYEQAYGLGETKARGRRLLKVVA